MDVQIKSLSKTVKTKEKEVHNLNKTLTNMKDTVCNLKEEVANSKIKQTKLDRENKRLKTILQKITQSVATQTASCIDTP